MEEPKAPQVQVPIPESTSSYDQREEPAESLYQFDTMELVTSRSGALSELIL
jgi:hypothetical protein